jgi:hypothetical protein
MLLHSDSGCKKIYKTKIKLIYKNLLKIQRGVFQTNLRSMRNTQAKNLDNLIKQEFSKLFKEI